jgi:hypothetical protein
MTVASVQLGPSVFGPNALWLGLRGFLMFVILVFSAFLFGAIFFTKVWGSRTRPPVLTWASTRLVRIR